MRFESAQLTVKKANFIILAVFTILICFACVTEQAVVDEPVPVIERTPVVRPGPEPVVVREPEIVHEEEPFVPLIEMISITGGTFQMGSPVRRDFQRRENPVREVTVRDFSLGKYEVTQGQYFEVTGARPSRSEINPEDESPDGWMKLPIDEVNWYDALIFCNKLSIKEGLDPVYRINGSVNPDDWIRFLVDFKVISQEEAEASILPERRFSVWDTAAEMIIGANGYRLPTEAEWEYAARGGNNSRGFLYAGSNTHLPNEAVRTRTLPLDDVAWYFDNSGIRSHEVGTKEPNELGLYDMSGNAFEWCWDWFDENYYSSANNRDNPIGPISTIERQPTRILRGGSFGVSGDFARVAYRQYNAPLDRFLGYGFRVARWE